MFDFCKSSAAKSISQTLLGTENYSLLVLLPNHNASVHRIVLPEIPRGLTITLYLWRNEIADFNPLRACLLYEMAKYTRLAVRDRCVYSKNSINCGWSSYKSLHYLKKLLELKWFTKDVVHPCFQCSIDLFLSSIGSDCYHRNSLGNCTFSLELSYVMYAG
jgi:hypothetical protein